MVCFKAVYNMTGKEVCKICGGTTESVFQANILNKYPVTYWQCRQCSFIQTDEPFWLKESYESAICDLDIGLVGRNIGNADILDCIIGSSFNGAGKFIDYAGGYGMLVRMMRDKGYDFYRQDMYCENLFAKTFDIKDAGRDNTEGFELLTAYEVFEHLANPFEEITKMFTYSKNILFSTSLLPPGKIKDSNDWWYFVPETGQHIAFYTEASLQVIAQRFNTKYYKLSNGLHLFTNKKVSATQLVLLERISIWRFIYKKVLMKKRISLLGTDFNKLIGRDVF
jgi:methyltransferase family protein